METRNKTCDILRISEGDERGTVSSRADQAFGYSFWAFEKEQAVPPLGQIDKRTPRVIAVCRHQTVRPARLAVLLPSLPPVAVTLPHYYRSQQNGSALLLLSSSPGTVSISISALPVLRSAVAEYWYLPADPHTGRRRRLLSQQSTQYHRRATRRHTRLYRSRHRHIVTCEPPDTPLHSNG